MTSLLRLNLEITIYKDLGYRALPASQSYYSNSMLLRT